MKTKNALTTAFSLLIALVMLAGCAAPAANPDEVESLLIAAEQQKWDQFAAGGMEDLDLNLYAEDFINIGYYPTGILRQTKAEAFAPPADSSMVPPPMVGMIELSDFIVVHASENAAIVSYKVTAPFGTMYVSSTWALRDGEWQTVFYQASPLSSPEAEAPAGDPISELFSGSYRADVSSGQDVLLLNPDGTFAVDAGATGTYGTTGAFVIDGNVIRFTDDERTDVPVCTGPERSASYSYTFTGSTLVLTSMDDTCAGRLAYFADRTWEK